MKKDNTSLPPENIPQPEDMEIDNFDGLDDSDVPIHAVIENIVDETAPKGYVVSIGGRLAADVDAERFDEGAPEEIDGKDDGDKELGRGKRRKQANSLYHVKNFWTMMTKPERIKCTSQMSQISDILFIFKEKIQYILNLGHSRCDLGQVTDFSHIQGACDP
jgi:hypothetical protein